MFYQYFYKPTGNTYTYIFLCDKSNSEKLDLCRLYTVTNVTYKRTVGRNRVPKKCRFLDTFTEFCCIYSRETPLTVRTNV